jgi:hypothetical protein
MCVLTVSGAMDRVRATSLLERPWAIKKRISYGQKTKRAENSRLTIHHSVAVLKAPKARQIPVGLRNRPCFNQLAELRSTITRRRCVRLKSTWFASHRVRALGPSNPVSMRAACASEAPTHLLASTSSVHLPQRDPCGTRSTANSLDFIGGYSRTRTWNPADQ